MANATLCTTLFFSTILMAVLTDQTIITAESGQDVTLSCRAANNNKPIIVVKWSRRDLNGHYVLMYRDQQFVPDEQHPSFENRVDLQDRQMKNGDVSLILKDVTTADNGTYECHVVQGVKQPLKLISIIDLRVDPPGQTGGHPGVGPVGLIVVLSVSAVLLVVGF
ncbi:V-set and immunoglobulin domain-containing protein 8-like [Neolamprologus brichardi]|uniref:V-set and immunoglobulin domain-containing protein 8-like n=1 Tax=Neolamprologus brichardi TaxID=32507 RepID=UPI001643BF20|nr:V-set and immunoglobulin domain-containing protein 8-like [Neolamprologus brichardi]